MQKLLLIAVLINCGLATFWAFLGSIENTVFSCFCSVLCWIGYTFRDKGENNE